MEVQSIIVFSMELIGTIAFAASGAMTGINGKMDIFGSSDLSRRSVCVSDCVCPLIFQEKSVPGKIWSPIRQNHVGYGLYRTGHIYGSRGNDRNP